MSNETKHGGAVDVLSVMDDDRMILDSTNRISPIPTFLRDHDEARAAVEELIKAGKAMPTFSTMHECDCETCTAIVRFNAALANVGSAS